MSTLTTISLILLGLFALFVILIIYNYNTLIAQIEETTNNNKEIDIQLDRRFKVLQSLIETVKKSMDYEKSTLKEVIALRSQAETARSQGDTASRINAENGISKIVSGLNLVFEQYPELKANQNAMQLQEEIVSTENRLAFAKQAYNDSVERYNANKKSLVFPALTVAMFTAKVDKDFPYWGLNAATIAEHEAYIVKF